MPISKTKMKNAVIADLAPAIPDTAYAQCSAGCSS